VGLSEITAVRDGYVVIERDDLTGDFAELKSLVQFSGRDLFRGVSSADKRTFDLLPDLLAQNGWVSDKTEGFAVARDGNAFLVTDNDAVDGWSGETTFLSLGRLGRLF
jgi:hypothetical protein